ncbi:MAG: protein kinase domain-containing protein, partial [Bradymonadaceae bacterium]
MVVFNVESSERLQGRYELGELIGEGGFARVYAGFDTVLERAVAVKFLNLAIAGHGLAQRERILTRFEQEAKIAAMLQHPSVVTIFDFGVVDDDSPQPYIVMERLDGSDLQAVLDEHGAMAPGRVLRLLTGCLLGLAVAHEAGVIHKDLKPSNLILCGEGTGEESLKIVDFGVAHLKTLQRRLTLDGSLQGTPQYLPPEYIKEQLVSPAYDVYQMGLVLVEMLTGQGVVGRSEPVASLLIHGSGRISVPSGLLSGPLGPVISRALSFDHHKRYADAREFATALQGLAPMDDGRIRDMAATPPILLVDSLPEIPQPGGQSSGVAGGQDFFGRDDELAALGTLLENHRLVTILGPGGMGKTRLTREFLRREDRQSASYFVELAGIDTLEGILASLGATLGGEEPVSTVDQVCHLLNTKESLLLVLDNLEQITDASAQLIESILAACENICILCTSRESLSLRGEALLVLEALSEEDAIRLFTHQARQKVYDFELDAAELEAVGSIARRVEGLPLALELAAGHVRILSPSQLAARLDESLGTIRSLNRDHGERHRH